MAHYKRRGWIQSHTPEEMDKFFLDATVSNIRSEIKKKLFYLENKYNVQLKEPEIDRDVVADYSRPELMDIINQQIKIIERKIRIKKILED